MQPRSVTIRTALALLAGLIILAGCSQGEQDPASSGHGSDPRRGANHRDPLAALRAGLAKPAGRSFYLSLGDSLSQGVQPTPAGHDVTTDRGYPDRLAARLRHGLPWLRLVKLGCSGETTVTMIHGGSCHYPAGSQLLQAARFLRSHRGRIALVTIDIGANDPNSCLMNGGVRAILPCVAGRMPQIDKNLGTIMSALRSAAGRHTLIVGMTYYVPELGLWRTGTTGKRVAILTGALAAGANKLLTDRYRQYGARVADVFAAFRTSDFGMKKRPGHSAAANRAGRPGTVPPNVATICALTWMCTRAPRGPDEHATNAGYRVIARAFWRTVTSSP